MAPPTDPRAAVTSGRALDTYKSMIRAQDGDPDASLPQAKHREQVLPAPSAGWLTRLDALAVGVAAWRLGAGRARKEDDVSHTAGVLCLAKPGEYVQEGQHILELRADDPDRFEAALDALRADVIAVGSEPPPQVPLIVAEVGG